MYFAFSSTRDNRLTAMNILNEMIHHGMQGDQPNRSRIRDRREESIGGTNNRIVF